jgi:hypothetical protein
MRLPRLAIFAMLALSVTTVAVAETRVELRLAGDDTIEAIVEGATLRERVYLRVVGSERRVPAVSAAPLGPDGFRATFQIHALPRDGAAHVLALDHGSSELARASIVLPPPAEPSQLRWLVIIGPLLGLLAIGLAVRLGLRAAGGAAARRSARASDRSPPASGQ